MRRNNRRCRFPGPELILAPLLVLSAKSETLRPWNEYRTIMWVGDSAGKRPEKLGLFCQRLREMGINTAMVYGDGDPKPLLENRFPYYVENIVNSGLCLKFNSKVTDWDKFVTDWARNGRSEEALVRDYCLDDPQWQKRAEKQMHDVATKNRDHNPLMYDIRDELSTTISANPFDYDFSPIALDGFRQWLRTQYADLAALNAEWETKFSSWNEVKPFTTDQIKNRMASGEAVPRGKPDWQQVQALKFDAVTAKNEPTRWNFSPWADFRSYMDLSLARALAGIRETAHTADPNTPVGIEGTQMPHAFGGYDLWRLSQVIDWVEPYDIGNAREIFGSFMSAKPLVTTVFESDTKHAQRRLWHLLLEGDRGCIIWWSEDCINWNTADYQLTAKAKALAPVLKELTSPLARLFLRAEREYDPIYIHYSQPSIQVDWLLESTVDGSTWLRRFSSYESEHNRMARVRNASLKLFQDLGYSPRFLSSEQLASGALPTNGPATLLLPSSWAVSDKEVGAIREFLAGKQSDSRLIFSDVPAGVFDEHGKLRVKPVQGEWFPVDLKNEVRAIRGNLRDGTASSPGQLREYLAERLKSENTSDWPGWMGKQMPPLPREISVPPAACVRIHRYHLGSDRLVAFERNIDYQMSEELKQRGGNEELEHEIAVEAKLARPAHVYDLMTEKYLGYMDVLRFTLNPWHPSLFALTTKDLGTGSVLDKLSAGAQPAESK